MIGRTAAIGLGLTVAALTLTTLAIQQIERRDSDRTQSADRGIAPPYFNGRDFTPLWTRPASPRPEQFDLLTQTGARFTDADVRGRVHVVSFFFTRCSTICPILVERLKRVQAEAPADVLLVSYSATPELDRPADLAAFGSRSGIDAARWRLVTGDRPQIVHLARQVYFADDPRLPENELLHTEKVLLIDRDGFIRGVYNGTQPFEIVKLLQDIHELNTPVPAPPV